MMREVFEELRALPASAVWAATHGRESLALQQQFSLIDGPRLVEEARNRGLRVEVLRSDTVSYLPYNETTKAARIIEDDAVAAAVASRMKLEGVRVRLQEVD
jgi:hypothetical protein